MNVGVFLPYLSADSGVVSVSGSRGAPPRSAAAGRGGALWRLAHKARAASSFFPREEGESNGYF